MDIEDKVFLCFVLICLLSLITFGYQLYQNPPNSKPEVNIEVTEIP